MIPDHRHRAYRKAINASGGVRGNAALNSSSPRFSPRSSWLNLASSRLDVSSVFSRDILARGEDNPRGGRGGRSSSHSLAHVLFSYADVWEYRRLGIPAEFTPKAASPTGRYFYYYYYFFFFFSPSYILRYPPGNPFIKRDQRSGKYPAERCM